MKVEPKEQSRNEVVYLRERCGLLEHENAAYKAEVQDLRDCLSYSSTLNADYEHSIAQLERQIKKMESDLKYATIVKEQYLHRIKELEHLDTMKSSLLESEVQLQMSRGSAQDHDQNIREKLFKYLAK